MLGMLRSQIKRALDRFIQLHRFKDFEKLSGHRTILRHFANIVTNQRGTGRQFFQKCCECTFWFRKASEGTQTDTDGQPDGHRAGTKRPPDGHRSNFELLSSHQAVTVRSPYDLCYHFSSTIRIEQTLTGSRMAQ